MKVAECYREVRTSKAGRPYNVLVIVFENGYRFEAFLNNEQAFILNDLPEV